jgi:hypothetical protein
MLAVIKINDKIYFDEIKNLEQTVIQGMNYLSKKYNCEIYPVGFSGCMRNPIDGNKDINFIAFNSTKNSDNSGFGEFFTFDKELEEFLKNIQLSKQKHIKIYVDKKGNEYTEDEVMLAEVDHLGCQFRDMVTKKSYRKTNNVDKWVKVEEKK